MNEAIVKALVDKKIIILIVYLYFLFICFGGFYFFNRFYLFWKYKSRRKKDESAKTLIIIKTLSFFNVFTENIGKYILGRRKNTGTAIAVKSKLDIEEKGYEEKDTILKPEILVGYRIIISFTGFLGSFIFEGYTGGVRLLFSFLIAATGFFIPDIIKKILINKKVRELEEELPYFIDILYVATIAGQNIYNAFKIICNENKGFIYEKFKKFISDINLGRGKLDAYEKLIKTCHSGEFKNLIKMLSTAEKYGSAINDLLREKSMQLKFNLRQEAERKARKTAVLCLFPLIFLILPAFILLVGGPLLYAIGGDFLNFF